MAKQPLNGCGAPRVTKLSLFLFLLFLFQPTVHAQLQCEGFLNLLGYATARHYQKFDGATHNNQFAAGLQYAVNALQSPLPLFTLRQWKELTTANFEKEAFANCENARRIAAAFAEEGAPEIDEAMVLSWHLKGILASMDPHSAYHLEDEWKTYTAALNSGELGFRLTDGKRYPVVQHVFPEGPAEDLLFEGDQIIKAQRLDTGETIECSTANRLGVVKFLTGDVGTQFELEVLRQGEVLKVIIVLASDGGSRVADHRLLDGGVGYIQLLDFDEGAALDVARAVDLLLAQNASSLMLDLRDNPGGLVREAVAIMDDFVDTGVAVIFQNRNGELEPDLMKVPGKRTDVPLAVVTNRFSASASELLAGGLSDFERALKVGETSFGKGTAQIVLPPESLQSGVHGSIDGALRLTSYQYFTPSGDSPQLSGESPHVQIIDQVLEEKLRIRRQQYAKLGYRLIVRESDFTNAIPAGVVPSHLTPDMGRNSMSWIAKSLGNFGRPTSNEKVEDPPFEKTRNMMRDYSTVCASYHKDDCTFSNQKPASRSVNLALARPQLTNVPKIKPL